MRVNHANYCVCCIPTYLIYSSVKPFFVTALNCLNTEAIPAHSEQYTVRGNNNMAIFYFSFHLSQGMIINYVHVHYANFAVIILMNLTNFNNILTSRLLNSLCISNILGIFLKLFCIYSFCSRENALHLNI